MVPLRHPVVLLDAGETLIGPRESFGAVYARVVAELGVERPAETWERALRAAWLDTARIVPAGEDRYAHYAGGEAEYWRRFVERALAGVSGVDRPAALAAAAVDPLREAFREPSAWRVYEDVVPTLEALHAMGARLAVVSNWDSRLPALLDGLGLARHFAAIVVSHLEGVEKPRPEPFLRAVARLGARPEDALHVGDTPELDGAGAAAAGIACVLVDRHGRTGRPRALPDLSPLPEIAASGLDGRTTPSFRPS